MPTWLENLLPILILLTVVVVVVARLPKQELGHSAAFKQRRVMNWLPVGLAYAFMYMARYNLTAYKNAVGMTNADYGTIDEWGSIVYGLAFLLNGPLADRFGGRTTMMVGIAGSAVMNGVMGYLALDGWQHDEGRTFGYAYAANMYFQSFGAVSIVKVNASWFHLRERGTFGGIFGILISLGLYFAYDWTRKIAEMWGVAAPKNAPAIDPSIAADHWVFWVPALILLVMGTAVALLVRDTPGHAGHADFDTGDAGSDHKGPARGLLTLLKLMLTNPVILTITAIEFCSGFLRNAVMKWHPVYAKAIGSDDLFVASNWGMLLCCAGILGGVFAGTISDVLFHSRRGPVSAILYGGMVLGASGLFFLLGTPALGWMVLFMSLCVIGVHGMLSGTASMDFGGKKNVGIVVGIIDGFVYLGTALQAAVLKRILPEGDAAAIADNWWTWPAAMLPAAIVGLALSFVVWNARARVERPKVAEPKVAGAAG
ncbi:MAG: MFS transporter [Pseudomonadota bacterium]|nr:MFS transporter [Pseudomonadota bacterium]